jgi:metallo-beta-lactamase family protein
MLGSASIQLRVRENGRDHKVVFSGDLGPRGAPILKDYEPFEDGEAVVLESTYGDHDHRPFGETVEEFLEIVKTAVAEGGKILVPTFAVGRAQVLTLLLAWAFRERKIKPFRCFWTAPWPSRRREHLPSPPGVCGRMGHDPVRHGEGSMAQDLTDAADLHQAEDSRRSTIWKVPAWSWPGRGCVPVGESCITSSSTFGNLTLT